MTKASDNPFPSLLVQEAATDGSDFTNPAADYRRLFLGEDGQLHVKDSAGNVTDPFPTGTSVATDPLWDAAGDLAVGSGSNTAVRLAIGATDEMLLTRVSGAVAWQLPKFVGCKVYNSAAQTIGNNSETAVSFNSEDYDTATLHEGVTNPTRLTADRTGYWLLTAGVSFATDADGYRFIRFHKDGSTDVSTRSLNVSASSSFNSVIHATTVVQLNAGQYVEVLCYHNAGANLDIGHASARSLQNEATMTYLGS